MRKESIMNKRIQELAEQATRKAMWPGDPESGELDAKKFAELIVAATLDEVEDRAYYTGDRNWSDELDRQWVELEFGMGPLAQAQRKAGFRHE